MNRRIILYKGELISGDQNGNIRVWDLTANACSRELVPDSDNAVRSLTVASGSIFLDFPP